MRRRDLLLSLPALLATPARASAKLPVVASFSILADITREVAGPAAAVRSLVPRTAMCISMSPARPTCWRSGGQRWW